MTVERARLRSLRLVGFKSFAERTTLEFGPGISAIVGPNGSGKSNLADALRWTLGEQGRQLRTRRSEDVIFAGSAMRHATGMADVTLVLENGDRLLPLEYSEVALGRRLFRSGENEYLLNGQRVRLRDVLDLLDGANLADNAFLFIGQGMVDQALSLRPEERRPLFEEAAGVRRHERRRRQAEAQLEEAEGNLARVRDIVAELRPQARRLAAQAEQQAAREGAGEELAAALVAAARARWVVGAAARVAAEEELAAARGAADSVLRDLGLAEDAAAVLLERISQRAALARERRDALDEARARVTELRLAAGRRDATEEALQLDRERVAAERETAQTRLGGARRVLATDLPPDKADLDGEAAERLATVERELAIATAELAQAEAQDRVADERAASLRRARDARAIEVEQLGRRAEETRRRASEAASSADMAERAAAEAATEADRAGRALATAVHAEREAERSLAAARDAALAADARRAARAGQGERLAGRLEGLSGRLVTLEGEPQGEGTRRLLAAARRRGGRRVADGLEVDPSLRVAVEAALGPAIRAAEVSREVALSLRREAGHLVLAEGTMGPFGAAATGLLQAAREAGGGALIDAVRNDPVGVASRLLGTSVWVPDLAAALGLRERLPAGWQAVTREGEVIRADGVVRLGRPDPLLERRAERDRVAAEAEAVGRELAAARGEVTALVAEAERASTRAQQARLQAETARQARGAAEEAERHAAGRAEAAAREAAWTRAQAERLAREVGHADAAARAAQRGGEPPSARGPLRGPGTGDTSFDEAEGAAAAVWRARAAALQEQRRMLGAELERLASERRAAEDRRRRAELAVALEEERIAGLERRLAEASEAASRLAAERSGAASELALARDGEAEAAAAVRELDVDEIADRDRLAEAERTASAARDQLRQGQERTRAAEVAALEARLGLDTLREGLLVELAGLGPLGLRALSGAVGAARAIEASATGRAADDRDGGSGLEEAVAAELETAVDRVLAAWTQASRGSWATPDTEAPGRARLAALRRRYQEVGAANPFAATEYAEVRARLDVLEAQQADLERAIGLTRRLIAELSERIAEQFRSTFRALEGAFARRFEQLFDGGEAQLLLTDPDDLSATGIEIMARPPGKKRQALAMLSGGERALTAVALLFAMLDVRPVPFCVLDEVDAALDEANVTRFNQALRELASGTQFVVITHNRGTIEAADALYGITIGDDAVSRVISLRLADAGAVVGAAS